MKNKHYDLKKALAITIAVIAATVVTAKFIGLFMGDMSFVPQDPSPPSSTSGLAILGPFFILGMHVVPGAVIGFFLGYFLGFFIDKFFKIEKVSVFKLLFCIVIPAFIVTLPLALKKGASGYADGYAEAVAYAECDQIKVFINKGTIKKEVLENLPNGNRFWPAQSVDVWSDEPPEIHINPYVVRVSSDKVTLSTTSGDLINETPINCSYITEARARTIGFKENEAPFVAVLASLRSTSYRAVLFIYNHKGELVYKEKIKVGCSPQLVSYYNSTDNSESFFVKQGKNCILLYKYNNRS